MRNARTCACARRRPVSPRSAASVGRLVPRPLGGLFACQAAAKAHAVLVPAARRQVAWADVLCRGDAARLAAARLAANRAAVVSGALVLERRAGGWRARAARGGVSGGTGEQAAAEEPEEAHWLPRGRDVRGAEKRNCTRMWPLRHESVTLAWDGPTSRSPAAAAGCAVRRVVVEARLAPGSGSG